jgi:Tol biopolymer transport system component
MRLDDGLAEVAWGDVRQIGQPGDPASQLKSPEWSADGSVVAYEVSTQEPQNSQLRFVKSDGTATRTIGPGSMPSLSPDGKQAVFSLPDFGIMTTSVDQWSGAPLSATGYAAQWSPDGQFVAWIFENRIVVYDMKSKSSRPLLNDTQASEFRIIDIGLGWSHDSKSIAFKAIPKTQQEEVVTVVDIGASDKFQIVYSGRQINPDLSWHPDGKQILFSMGDAVTSTTRLYSAHRDSPGKPKLLPGQPPGWQIFDCDWSPDGRKIVFTAEPPREE